MEIRKVTHSLRINNFNNPVACTDGRPGLKKSIELIEEYINFGPRDKNKPLISHIEAITKEEFKSRWESNTNERYSKKEGKPL